MSGFAKAAKRGDTAGSPDQQDDNQPHATSPSRGQVARDAAAARRLAVAGNDAAHVKTKTTSLFVKCGVRMRRSFKSIAAGLEPPHGISIRRLRQLYGYELKYGADDIQQSVEIQAMSLARDPNTPPAVKHQALKTLRSVPARAETPRKSGPEKAERIVTVRMAPIIGDNEPDEHE